VTYRRTKAGVQENSIHGNIYGYPSMFIEVNGKKIEVLFDTGGHIGALRKWQKSI
jgi:hypothetical protein